VAYLIGFAGVLVGSAVGFALRSLIPFIVFFVLGGGVATWYSIVAKKRQIPDRERKARKAFLAERPQHLLAGRVDEAERPQHLLAGRVDEPEDS